MFFNPNQPVKCQNQQMSVIDLDHRRHIVWETEMPITRRECLAAAAGAGLPLKMWATRLNRAVTGDALAVQQTAPAPARSNVIWLLGDQHRAQALSCDGDPNARTPNLDRLSGLGVNLTAALSGFPLCCPFRGSLLTGRYPHHCVPGHEYPLPAGQATIARPFRDAGYRTAYFGKWHLDGFKAIGGFQDRSGRAAMHIIPPERRGGFDTWVGYQDNDSPWDSWVQGGAGKDAFHYRLPGYETDELTSLLIQYIRERGEEMKRGAAKPFFAVLSVQPPHDPYVAPEPYMLRYNGAHLRLRPNVPPVKSVRDTVRRDLAGYYAMIENWDHNVGRIRQVLEETGLSFSTHIVFFSDHGDMHGSHGQYRKTTPFEEAIRVPFLIGGEIPPLRGTAQRQISRAFEPRGHRAHYPGTVRYPEAGMDGRH